MKPDARLDRVKRERFMPFAFERHALRLTLRAVQKDDEPEVPPEPDELERGELFLEDDRWKRLRLRVHVDMEKDTLAKVLAQHELETPPISHLIRLHVPSTRVRRAIVLDAVEHAEREVELVISREDLGGTATLTPWLVRSTHAAAAPGFASRAGQKLATGGPLVIHPYAPRPKPGQFLDVQYRSFKEDVQLRRHPDRLYVLEANGTSPVLFINSDHREVADALDTKAQTGTKAKIREVFFDVLSVGVWTQLFMQAAEALDDEGVARHAWQHGVLTELLPVMFPGARNHSARVRELLAIRASDAPLRNLSELCDLALQKHLDLARHMQRLVQTSVESERS